MLKGSVLITGGAGTLGKAIVERANSESWDCTFTILSRDPIKHQQLKREYPECNFVLADIRDYDRLHTAFLGHDIVIHAAAQKHVVEAENNPADCFSTNITGSQNVCMAAYFAGVSQVALISTDKACYPINAYGTSKKAMEYIGREWNKIADGLTTYHICRYGNVLGSNGSVLQVWNSQLAQGKKPTITSPHMTRFWMTEDDAVDTVLFSLESEPGVTTVPLVKGLSMGDFARYLLGDVELDSIGLRPGEKVHECLITTHEPHTVKTRYGKMYAIIGAEDDITNTPYMSNSCEQLTADELREMVGV